MEKKRKLKNKVFSNYCLVYPLYTKSSPESFYELSYIHKKLSC